MGSKLNLMLNAFNHSPNKVTVKHLKKSESPL